jgi:hypothetical protein
MTTDTDKITRRRFLASSAVAAGTLAVSTTGPAAADHSDDDVTVTFVSQEVSGQEIVLSEISTSIEIEILVYLGDNDDGQDATEIVPAGEYSNYAIDIGEEITEAIEVELFILDTDEYETVDYRTATVYPEGDDPVDFSSPTRVNPAPSDGFNYPYYLYTPDTEGKPTTPILVEPVNSGQAANSLDPQIERAEYTVSESPVRRMSDALKAPLLVPVFPRPRGDPVSAYHYTHALDDTTMHIEDGPLERIDEQVLSMVDHAREQLEPTRFSPPEEIMLNGFSASGNFVDRFTVLHADRVLSVTAGGLNGMSILPAEEWDGEELPYHIGIADVEELTGDPVDFDALDETNQFLYMGVEDENDTLPYDDAFTDESDRQLVNRIFGDDMIEDRFPVCQEVYDAQDLDAQFKVYDDRGHRPAPVEELVEFHWRSIDGEDVSMFGEDVSGVTRPWNDEETESTPNSTDTENDTEESVGGEAAANSTDNTTESTDSEAPGFGIVSAVGGVIAGATALWYRYRNE